MPLGNIRKNYLYNLSFQIFSLLIPFITAPHLSRALMAEGIGTYSFVNSIATYFSLFAALGLSSYGTREVSRVRDNPRKASKLFWELSIIRLGNTMLCLGLYLLFILISGGNMRLYLAAGLVIATVAVDCSWFFQAMENFRVLTLRNFAIKLISVVCIFAFVDGPEDLLLYFIIQGGGMLLSNVALYVRLFGMLVPVPLHKLRLGRHIRETLIYFIPTIATSVYTLLDRTMIGIITQDMSANGYYEQAHKMVNMLMTVITSLNVVVGVRTSYLFGKNKKAEIRRHIHSTFRFMFLVTFPAAAGLIAVAPDFVPWFYGRGYEPVIGLMILLAPLLFIIGTSNVLGTLYLTPSGQRARSNRAIIAGAVVNFALNLILIPLFGVVGAVVSSLVAESVIAVLYVSYSARFISVPKLMGYAARYLLLAAIMFVPTYFIGQAHDPSVGTTLLQIAVGVITYILLLILVRDPAWMKVENALRNKLRRKAN